MCRAHRVRAIHLDRKGRGLALRHVWSGSTADVVSYMDADLSTGLDAFGPLIAPLVSGHSDLATGSRLSPGATWLVAVRGSDSAAAIIRRAHGMPVMAMGGFSGTDPAPTVAQLQQYVTEGKLHYVLIEGAGGIAGFGGGAGTASSVNSWVEQNCTAVPASAYGGSAGSGAVGGGTGGRYRCG